MGVTGAKRVDREKRFYAKVHDVDDGTMYIPQVFCSRYLGNIQGQVMVVTPDGMTWMMSLGVGTNGLIFEKGWSRFRDWYMLHEEQLLFFSVNDELMFKAAIFETASGCEKNLGAHSEIEYQATEMGIRGPLCRDTERRFIAVVRSDDSDSLMIPPYVTAAYLQRTLGAVKLSTCDGMMWSMEIGGVPGGFCFTKGWCRFRDWYELQAGQIIHFTVDLDMNFEVRIYDANTHCEIELSEMTRYVRDTEPVLVDMYGGSSFSGGTDTSSVCPGSVQDSICGGSADSSDWELSGHPMLRDTSFITNPAGRQLVFMNSYFVVIQEAHVSGDYKMFIPRDFAMTNLSDGKNDRRLRAIGRPKVFEVCCMYQAGVARITTGWKEFAEENKLRVQQGWIVKISVEDPRLWLLKQI